MERLRRGLSSIIVCLLICFLPLPHHFISSNAQSFQSDINIGNPDLIWSYTFGTNDSDDTAYSVIQCSEGGYLIIGSTRMTGTLDVIIIRLNETGELEWTNTLILEGDQNAQEAIECESGGFAIIGYSQEQLPNGTLLNYNAYLIRIHANGSIAWTQTIGTSASQQAYSIVESSLGGFAFAGYSTNIESGDSDFWLVRTDSEGQPLWNQTYDSSGSDVCYSLVENQIGSFVLVGSRQNRGSGDQDGWIISTNYDGSLQWNITYGGPRNDICTDVVQSTRFEAELRVVGTTDRGPNGGLDVFVLTVYSSGNLMSNITLGGFYSEEAYSIISCHDFGFAITGYTVEQTSGGPRQFLWVARLDYWENVEWYKRYGGAGREIGRSIIQGPNHNFIIAGTTEPYQDDNIGTDIWIISIPDISPLYTPGQPNFVLILFGIVTGVLIIMIAALIYTESKKNLLYVETKASMHS